MKRTALDANAAATLALQALAFLAEDGERLGRFLALTGLSPQDLSGRAAETGFQAAVLEYLLGDERLLLQFCDHAAIDPHLPATALGLLAGRH